MTERLDKITRYAEQSAKTLSSQTIANAGRLINAADSICNALENNGKVLFFGNGGSAADSQHLAAELVNRYLHDRKELPGLALTTDTSVLTAIGNDYGFDLVFEKQIQALARPGDIAVGISTSGTSENVIKGLKAAAILGCVTIGFSGRNDSVMSSICTHVLSVDAPSTPMIQQVHLTMGHLLCEMVEEHFLALKEKT